MHKFSSASFALALAMPFVAMADTRSDIDTLRQQIESMRASYEARLQALEVRLKAAEAAASTSPQPVTATANSAAAATDPSTQPPSTTSAATATATATANPNSFNPAMSLILSGLYARTSKDPANYKISGFQLPVGAETGPGTRGFSLAESELGFAASIDPWFRGAANIAVHSDNTVSVEEAYVQTTSLGLGLTAKAGRFFSGIGYLNSQHAHTWDFVDNPLAYQAMLGTQLGDDGVQFSWLAPIDHYVELGLEVARGRSFPGSDTSRNGAGMTALMAHTGGDVGESHNWRAGLSMLSAKASDQMLEGTDASGMPVINAFNGRTRVWVADAVWKWAPNGNATRTSFKLQGEYLRSTRTGELTYDVANANSTADYRAVQSGWYLQGIYQFMPRWRVGLRAERLDAGTPDFGLNTGLLGASTYRPAKQTLMFDYSPSEFSRLRLQFARDRARQGITDNQFFLQYQMSLGAHGAHSY